MQWAGTSALLGGVFGRRASAASVPYVGMALAGLNLNPANGTGLWLLDQMRNIRTLGGAPVFGNPPDPERSPFVAMVPSASGLGLYALTMDGKLHTVGDAVDFSAPLP